MKRQIITLALSVSTFASFAQWTLVKKFNKPTRFIESNQQGIVIATDSSYYIQQDPTFQNWAKYTLNDFILDMDSKDNYVYFAASKRIYEHLTAPVKIHEVTNTSFSSINIYKGKKLVSVNTPTSPSIPNAYTTFCTFATPFSSFDTLYNTDIYIKSYLTTISSDDSLAFLGYGAGIGGYIYIEKLKKWNAFIPMEREVVYDSYVNNKVIMLRYKKAGTDFYISHDYGKTYVTKADAFPFNNNTGSVMEYDKGNAFIGFSNNYIKGVFQSSNDGQSWTNILADTSITGIAIKGNDLFVTTTKGSLLKTAIKTIVTSVDKIDSEFATKPYYTDKIINNNTTSQIEYSVYDLAGKKVSVGTIAPNNQSLINLIDGIYIIDYRNNKLTSREKIYVW